MEPGAVPAPSKGPNVLGLSPDFRVFLPPPFYVNLSQGLLSLFDRTIHP